MCEGGGGEGGEGGGGDSGEGKIGYLQIFFGSLSKLTFGNSRYFWAL